MMSERKPYDNRRITNIDDDTTIEGYDAVKAYFDRERELLEARGSSITFQLFRANLKAQTFEELQGKQLAEFRINGDMVSGTDTVALVKQAVLPSLLGNVEESDHITFFFAGRRMQDDALFYAEHFMMLPAWVQIVLHECEFEELETAIRRLTKPAADL
jgi:hypothetical protein